MRSIGLCVVAVVWPPCVNLGCGKGGGESSEVHAVGSIAYHAAPTRCQVTGNDGGALVVHADHYAAKDGKGIVVEAAKPGSAAIDCDGQKTKITVREAASVIVYRTDDESKPISIKDLYAPQFCMKALDAKGGELEVGRFTEGIEFTTSEQLRRVVDHGMGGSAGAACLDQQSPAAPGQGSVAVSWRGMTEQATFEVIGN